MFPHRSDRTFLWATAGTAAVAGITVYLVASLAPPVIEAAARSGGPGRSAEARGGAARGSVKTPPSRRSSRFSAGARWRRQRVFAEVQGAEAFTRLGEPQPGDWLWSFRERGETLEEYCRAVVNRKTAARHTLHLQPFSDLSPAQLAVLPAMREHTAIFFDTEVSVLPTRAPDPAWYSARRRQSDADRIVRDLARRVPRDSLGVFGLMGRDLYGMDLNYLFGEALLHERAGVYSLHRYGTARPELRRRALKLSAHELGHMFGLQHCVFYECLMNGTNSLPELDGQPLHLCPVCLAKLHWNLRFDPAARYRKLEAFYRRHGLEAEARFVHARLGEVAALAPAPASAPAPAR